MLLKERLNIKGGFSAYIACVECIENPECFKEELNEFENTEELTSFMEECLNNMTTDEKKHCLKRYNLAYLKENYWGKEVLNDLVSIKKDKILRYR